jgi:hypothetical protein
MRNVFFLVTAVIVFVSQPCIAAAEPTWIEIDNVVYGAKADGRGPIGGGNGYVNIITAGDYTVRDLDALLDALSKAKSGQVVFIPAETVIDLTARIYINQLVLEIPEGVTLAGDRGHGKSQGALLTSDALKTPVMIRAAGPDVRVTGLRIQGPNPKRYLDHHRRSFGQGGAGREYYYKLPTSNGIRTKYPRLEHIHHNHIHHCQYQGLGYGVSHNTASSMIEHNFFNWNRHSIAGTGRPGNSYVARHNVELGVSLSHCFDMHGGRDRKDGTDIAGTSIDIYNNTFRAQQTPVVIRGVPEEKCEVHHNWFLRHNKAEQAVRSSGKTKVFSNAYTDKPKVAK